MGQCQFSALQNTVSTSIRNVAGFPDLSLSIVRDRDGYSLSIVFYRRILSLWLKMRFRGYG